MSPVPSSAGVAPPLTITLPPLQEEEENTPSPSLPVAPKSTPNAQPRCELCDLVAPLNDKQICAICHAYNEEEAVRMVEEERWLNEICGRCHNRNSECECSQDHDADEEERRHVRRCVVCYCDMSDGTDWWITCSRSCNRIYAGYGY